MKYEIRFNHKLNLSGDQLSKISLISALTHAIEWAGIREDDIPNLNPVWLRREVSWKSNTSLSDRDLKELKENGETFLYNIGANLRKTKNGYVLDVRPNKRYNFKNIIKTKVFCEYCKDEELINDCCICEKCEKKLKKERKYLKFIRGEIK